MTKLLFLTVASALLWIAPLAAQSQNTLIAHIHLRMSMDDFPKDACQNLAKGIARCLARDAYLGVGLRIQALFIDDKLAEIAIEPPEDFGDCFDLRSLRLPAEPSYQRERDIRECSELHYTQLLEALTGTWGHPVEVKPEKLDEFHPVLALRWENDQAIAEFQNHSCGPDGSAAGRSKEIAEILAGQYCRAGDISAWRASYIVFLDKELGRALSVRLAGM